MNRILCAATVFLFAFCAIGIAAETDPKGVKKPGATIEKKASDAIRVDSSRKKPESLMSISVVRADIRNNGYTVEIRNGSANAFGELTVQCSKGKNDKAPFAAAGGVRVQNLAAGASTQVTIDQPAGWNSGYTLLKVEVRKPTDTPATVVVGRKTFDIPSF